MFIRAFTLCSHVHLSIYSHAEQM